MKLSMSTLLLLLSIFCYAENSSLSCDITKETLNLSTPTADNIANTFWQEGHDGYEKVNRLHILYKDGSVAVLEHKYCIMYNFEVAYYSSNALSESRDIVELFENFLTFSGAQDASGKKAAAAINKRLDEKGFNSGRAVATTYDGSTSNNQLVEYSISYQPLEDSSLHKSAVFIYLGIGGEH